MRAFLAERTPLRDWRPLPLIPRLTAFMVIVASSRDVGRLSLGLVVTLIVFGSDRVARNGWFWIGVSVIVTGWNLYDWATIDNHIWLSGYWYLALGLALLADEPERRMASAARLLIGLVFTVAVIRKALNPEFVNGDFFVFTLLIDPRFETIASTVGGVADTSVNDAAVGLLPEPVVLASASGIRPLAVALTAGTFAVESAVAAFNLLPARVWRTAGQVSLAVFILVTYFIVPVVAFGAGLIAMGAASAATDKARRNWVIVFFALVVWGFLWQGYSL